MSKNIVLGGRAFAPLARFTLEHDEWMLGLGGLEYAQREGESDAAAEARIMTEIVRSGRARRILAGLLVPVRKPPVEWSPEIAEETAAFLGQIEDEKDKQTVIDEMLVVLAHFRESGRLRLESSAPSSTTAREDRPTVQ